MPPYILAAYGFQAEIHIAAASEDAAVISKRQIRQQRARGGSAEIDAGAEARADPKRTLA